jgi:cytochrome c553
VNGAARRGLALALTLGLAAALAVRSLAAPAIPERLSDPGLYLPGTLTVDPRNRPFSPQYPLWTDGAGKSRWIQLPAGGRITARDADTWEFPVGTRLWKEFAFGGRKVETRMLWRAAADRWSYAAYVWNAAQTEATLVPAEGLAGVVEVAPGKRHSVPSRDDCQACHENGGTSVLGFTALQLSPDRDPAAPHFEPLQPGMITLQMLIDERLIDTPQPALFARAPRIPGDPRTRAALGYLSANCGHCHNADSAIATVRFPLRMPAYASVAQVDRAIAALVARANRWDLPHSAPGTTSTVKPGAPDLSALLVRMRSRRPSSQMPPLGTTLPDRDAIDLVSAWIDELGRRDVAIAATPGSVSR